jgi:uncharacterized repeat protein (TIGR01451 family)
MGSVSVQGAFDGQILRIGDNNEQGVAPYFYGDMDAAGYSDWIWYGPSPIHDHGYHEVLSGEWGAAIYYDGIDTNLTNDPNDAANRRQAMWLTKDYVFPGWTTNSDFVFGGTCIAQQNPNNPAPLYDTGKSVIYNDQVEITIDYEVVDLEFRDPNLYESRSPMGFIDEATGLPVSMPSERYCFLQTYTVRNLTSQTLTGLEFYQLHHSHGNNEYAAAVNSTYTDIAWDDPLEDYTPYDSVHTVGNFRYDITQWNSMRAPGSANHIDYVCFSSTIEPDWIDNDVYKGHSGKPTSGTHLHVEDRNLNGIDAIYMKEVCGAMGWSLASLEPNATTSITLAYMFSIETEAESSVELTKTILDPNDCYSPGDELTYRIEWENLSDQAAENAVLYDYFPAGVTYPVEYSFDPNFQMVSSDPNYVDGENVYVLEIGTIPAFGSGSLDLSVIVNEKAIPKGILRNIAEIHTSIGSDRKVYDANVCCWSTSNIIYVDQNAQGNNNGNSWQDAMVDLQDALARYATGCGSEIWVAQGVYDPGRDAGTTFTLPDGVSVYGGFKSGGCDFNDRKPKQYETILSGLADNDTPNDTIVTMGDETLLDGFTVTDAADYGIYGSDVDFSIESCTVTGNEDFGVYTQNGNVTLKWCEVKKNGLYGIFHDGQDFTLTVENSQIRKNSEYGIFCQNSTPTVKNSIVSENDLKEAGREGIFINNPKNPPVLHNNTFAHNRSEGVFFTDNGTISDPNGRDWPDVQNCILWHNNNGGGQFSGFSKAHVYYSCIYDPNDPNGVSLTLDDNDNFSANPKIAYFDPNNVHLAYDSPCKDAGNPSLSYTNQVDMDSEDRVVGDYVDIGADELFSCDEDYSEDDFHNDLDWNADGVVNLVEFSEFQRVWLSHDPNDPTDPNLLDPNDFINWNPVCNLDATGNSQYAIDLADLDIFWDNWLWTACWLTEEYLEMMSGGESMMMAESVISVQTEIQLEESPVVEEISIEEQILSLWDCIAFLEQIWLEEPDIQQEIDAETWKEFMDAVYHGILELQELKTESVQME